MNKSPYNSNKNSISVSPAFGAVLLATFCLFLVSVVALTACLIKNSADGKKADTCDDTDISTDIDSDTQPFVPVVSIPKSGVKSGIVVPCVTGEGAERSIAAENVVDITATGDIKSAHAILVELTGNTSIVEKGADTRVYPASMTKIMTLLVACENARNANDRMAVTQEMVDYHKNTGGSGQMAFVAGEAITVEDALHLVIYDSDTIACLLLAEYVAGSEAEFVALMNAKAAELGLSGTNFKNCTGLHNEEHYTTCRDMATIMACVLKNNAAKQILTSFNGYVVDIYDNMESKLSRTSLAYADWYSGRLEDNPWAGNGSDVKIMGGKTGYEDVPRYCFVTYAQNTSTNTEYICVTVGRSNEQQYSIRLVESVSDTKRLYQKYAVK